MKLLHITDAAAGGVLSSVTALARSQAADPRFDQVGFCYTPRADSPSHDEIAIGMGCRVMVECWAQTSKSSVTSLMRGLARELRNNHWDVIHLHSSRAGFLARSLAILLRPRAHLVYSPHGFSFNQIEFSNRAREVYLRLERVALHGGRDLVLVSGTEAECAAEKLPGARTAVLANAVDTSHFAPVDTSRGPASEVVEVVHLGRVATQKNPGQFAQIASLVHREYPGRFAFTWIGDGDRSLLEAETGALDDPRGDASAPAVSVTGWVSPEEIREHLSAAAILLFTSAAEGMPIAMLEAGSMAIPTVGADVIGVRDLIDDDVDGSLFRTSAEAVAALGDLLSGERRRSLGLRARERVVREHSQADLAGRSLHIYTGFIRAETIRRRGGTSVPARPPTKITTVHSHVSNTESRTA
ncbi:MAG: glycosyltransferase [Brevibacterium aurantiacum]